MKACELENLLLRNMIENDTVNNTILPKVKECSDNIFDVNGDVIIVNYDIDSLGVKFNNVSGSFWVISSKLNSLEILPAYVGGRVTLFGNQLESLKGFNTKGTKFIDLDDNYLTNLDGIDPNYDGHLSAKNNFLFEVPKTKKYNLDYVNNFVIGSNIKVQKNNPGNSINKANIEIAIKRFEDKFYNSEKVKKALEIKGEDFLLKFLDDVEQRNSDLDLDLSDLKGWVRISSKAENLKDILDI